MTRLEHVTPERGVDELLYRLPSALTRADAQPFTRNFVRSVLAQSRRRGWQPSPKQLAMMRRIVADMFTPVEPDFEVIDMSD